MSEREREEKTSDLKACSKIKRKDIKDWPKSNFITIKTGKRAKLGKNRQLMPGNKYISGTLWLRGLVVLGSSPTWLRDKLVRKDQYIIYEYSSSYLSIIRKKLCAIY